jgi:adenosylhomocysteine nucleosidase
MNDAYIGLIGAMPAEVDCLKRALSLDDTFQRGTILFYRGSYRGQKIILARSGVGKVNAAIAVQVMIHHFKPKGIFGFGVAGAINPDCAIGDIILGEKLIQHDFGWFTKGQFVPEQLFFYRDKKKEKIPWFVSHPVLIKTAQNIGQQASFQNKKIYTGVIVSGDQVISMEEKRKDLALRYNALATDMESAAIAQAAFMNQVPFLIIRAISDNATVTVEGNCVKKLKLGLQARKDFALAMERETTFLCELLRQIDGLPF